MAVEVCMSQESVWFDQMKYEDAEARYQEIVADRHAGLHVEVGDFVTFSAVVYIILVATLAMKWLVLLSITKRELK